MQVRILQGKKTGCVVEVCQSEGENMLTTGFAELAPLPPVAAAPQDETTPAAPTRRPRASRQKAKAPQARSKSKKSK